MGGELTVQSAPENGTAILGGPSSDRPELCVTHREMRDEALTGEPAGQPLSREIETPVQSADPQATWNLSSKSKHDCDLARATPARVIAQLLRRAVCWRGPFSELRFGEHPRACGNNSPTLLPRMRRQRMAAVD
jgi:hypothetical protein